MAAFDGCNGNVAQCDNGLQNWDVSRVQSMNAMFYSATAFNNDLSTWKTTKVVDMKNMFAAASAFNGDISTWVSRVALCWRGPVPRMLPRNFLRFLRFLMFAMCF